MHFLHSTRGCSSLCCTNKANVHQHYNPPTDCKKTSDARYSPTDCTDFHRLGGYGIPAIPTQPQNYLPTEFTEHTETTGGEEKSVYICEICGRLLPARRFCGFCVFRGRFLSEAMLVQRRPLHPLKIATLQQQDCHATATRLPRYGKMSRDGCKMNWQIPWQIDSKKRASVSLYIVDTQRFALHTDRYGRFFQLLDFIYSFITPYTTHPIQFSGVTTAFSFTSYAVRNEEGN